MRKQHKPEKGGQAMKRTLYAVMFLALLFSTSSAFANYFDKDLGTGQVRVYYKSPSPAACEAIVLGVGTAMSRDSYDNLAAAISSYGYIVVIMDHQPGSMTKTDAGKFKNCVIEVQNSILGWLSGTGCTSIAHWILGGHSAGGQAAKLHGTTGGHRCFAIDRETRPQEESRNSAQAFLSGTPTTVQ